RRNCGRSSKPSKLSTISTKCAVFGRLAPPEPSPPSPRRPGYGPRANPPSPRPARTSSAPRAGFHGGWHSGTQPAQEAQGDETASVTMSECVPGQGSMWHTDVAHTHGLTRPPSQNASPRSSTTPAAAGAAGSYLWNLSSPPRPPQP